MFIFTIYFKMLLNYRDRNWSFRFRLLELICCMALIILGILLLIYTTELKLFIVLPILVFGSAFTLICLYSFFGFGMQQSIGAFRSWIVFAAAGMALFFMTAGFLLVPTKFGYVSHLLHTAISLALLTGIIFLLDMLFMIRHLHKLIFPEATKDTTQIRQDIQSRNVEVQTGGATMIPIEGEVIKNYVCDQCHERIQEGIECSSICPPQPEVSSKFTQMSLESSQFIEKEANVQPKIEAISSQCYAPSYLAKPIKKESVCSAEECIAKYISIGDNTEDGKKHNIQSTKYVQPKIKIPCDPNICKKNVLQVTRSIQVTPNPVVSKSSRESSRIPLKVCDRKLCLKREESTEMISSKNKESFLKLVRAPKVAPTPPDVSEIRIEQTNFQKRAKGKVCPHDCTVSTNEEGRSIYSNKPSYTSQKPSHEKKIQTMKNSSNATIESVSTVSRNKSEDTREKEQLIISESYAYKPNATAFTETPQVITSDKSLQTSNKDSRDPVCIEPDRFGLKRSHTSMEIPEKKSKIPQLLQTSQSMQTSSLLRKEKVETLDKTTCCKTYEPKVNEKEPIIIVLKDYQAPSSQNRQAIVEICPFQCDQVKSIYSVNESPKDVSMQVTDYFEKKKTLTPELNIHNAEMDENTKFSNIVYCGCNDKTPSEEGICCTCYKQIREELELQNQENTVPPPSSRDSLLAQQPYAYSPKRNGLDEFRQASPNFKYYETSSKDMRQPPQSARIEQVQRGGLRNKKMHTSLPASATYKKDPNLRKAMFDTPEK